MVNHTAMRVECDVCRREQDVRRCRIEIEGTSGRHVDLCGQCREPLEELVERIDKARPPRTGLRELPVLTEDELQALMGTLDAQRPRTP